MQIRPETFLFEIKLLYSLKDNVYIQLLFLLRLSYRDEDDTETENLSNGIETFRHLRKFMNIMALTKTCWQGQGHI